jgi:hypothetical protein
LQGPRALTYRIEKPLPIGIVRESVGVRLILLKFPASEQPRNAAGLVNAHYNGQTNISTMTSSKRPVPAV